MASHASSYRRCRGAESTQRGPGMLANQGTGGRGAWQADRETFVKANTGGMYAPPHTCRLSLGRQISGYLEKGIQTPMTQGRSTKIISKMKWIRTSRLSIKNSLSPCMHARSSSWRLRLALSRLPHVKIPGRMPGACAGAPTPPQDRPTGNNTKRCKDVCLSAEARNWP